MPVRRPVGRTSRRVGCGVALGAGALAFLGSAFFGGSGFLGAGRGSGLGGAGSGRTTGSGSG